MSGATYNIWYLNRSRLADEFNGTRAEAMEEIDRFSFATPGSVFPDFRKTHNKVQADYKLPDERRHECPLDDIFEIFNNYDRNPLANEQSNAERRAMGCMHTSMSVGDVIEVVEEDFVVKWFVVMGVGFHELDTGATVHRFEEDKK